MRLLVTGGAGFIGGHLVERLLDEPRNRVLILDRLTYAADPDACPGDSHGGRCRLVQGDVCDGALVAELLADFRPHAVLHLAAESHVDRSLDSPEAVVRTNVQGAAKLVTAVLDYWQVLAPAARYAFRYLQLSTDEVYGDLGTSDPAWTTDAPLAGSSPYAASKAAADLLVAAWQRSYGLPTLIVRSCNAYGPRQHPEKLIPLMIRRAVAGLDLPVYGDGQQRRDWLYVDDLVSGALATLQAGRPGEVHHLAGGGELTNLTLLQTLCGLLDARLDRTAGETAAAIRHVADRPGHDRRYALDDSASRAALAWSPASPLVQGLKRTVDWYLANAGWLERALAKAPEAAHRLGLARAD